jgi:hypothetical protein
MIIKLCDAPCNLSKCHESEHVTWMLYFSTIIFKAIPLVFMQFCAGVSIVILWVVTPCGLVGWYEHFGRTYHLHLRRHYEKVWQAERLVEFCEASFVSTKKILLIQEWQKRVNPLLFHSLYAMCHLFVVGCVFSPMRLSAGRIRNAILSTH